MDNHTIIVTGATSGIGQAIAEGLAAKGARLVLPCRNLEKGQAIGQTIQSTTGNDQLQVQYCDLAKMNTIRDFTAQFCRSESDLYAVFNCAGALFFKRKVTEDGLESNLAVNYLGQFLLTKGLLDHYSSTPVKVINLAGEFHRFFQMNLDDFQYEKKFSGLRAGSVGMLQRIMHASCLATHYASQGVQAYSYHPGRIRSNLLNELPLGIRHLGKLLQPLFSPAEMGADTGIWLMETEAGELKNGSYYRDRKLREPAKAALDKDLQEQLWQKSVQTVEKWLEKS